jgi:hypothetical protein
VELVDLNVETMNLFARMDDFEEFNGYVTKRVDCLRLVADIVPQVLQELEVRQPAIRRNLFVLE